MFILLIEHPVPDFNGWKKAFDSDPLNRQNSGVKSHRIYRETGNSNNVVIELEFEDLEKATKMHTALKQLWSRVQGTVMMNPQSRIIETVENIQY